jgi:hypothetical protein
MRGSFTCVQSIYRDSYQTSYQGKKLFHLMKGGRQRG